jgi:hypothetical protein
LIGLMALMDKDARANGFTIAGASFGLLLGTWIPVLRILAQFR